MYAEHSRVRAVREVDTSTPADRKRHQVVVHFKGGRLLKGYTDDFAPGKHEFSLISALHRDNGRTYQIRVDDLKAIFFVRRLAGNPFYRERKRFKEVDTSHLRGLRIQLRFTDGEVIRGTTRDYNEGRKGFFVSPVDPRSNNLIIYVLNDALLDVKLATEVLD